MFRERLREFRQARHLSQAQLAARVNAQGGVVTQTTITRLERGPREVTLDEMLSLARALNVSPLALLLPTGDAGEVMSIDGVQVTAGKVVDWFLGHSPIDRGIEAQLAYFSALPSYLLEVRDRQFADRLRAEAEDPRTNAKDRAVALEVARELESNADKTRSKRRG